MSAFILILLFIVSTCDSLSIGVKQNVTKRETDVNFFPEWVPFKNKHGDELGEFIDVAKPKPKKRLAPPVNFVMRAVADSEADDYYDKGQGGGDSEDYYEKKEWSDQHRLGKVPDSNQVLNHSDISDIDGIVNIITKPSNNPVLIALNKRRKISRRNKERENEEEITVKSESDDIVKETTENKDRISDYQSKNEDTIPEKDNEKNEDDTEEKEDDEDKNENEDKTENENKDKNGNENESTNVNEDNKEVSKKNYDNDSVDYDESTTGNEKIEPGKSEAEKNKKQRENEAKKAKILNSVDELKERHAQEQRSISEKIKEEEMFEEELERELERMGAKRHSDDKYAHPVSKWKKIIKDYDEFEDREPSFNDKYKINIYETTTTTTTTTTTSPRKTTKRRQKLNKIVEDGKLSVFKNPNLYTVNDEDEYSTTLRPKQSKIRKPEKFSSKYSAQPYRDDDNVRISLVPVDNDSKEGEPTLFFPKLKKNKRRFKIKTTTPIPDTTADSSEERVSDLTGVTASRTDSFTESGTSGADAYSSASTAQHNTAPSAETSPDTAPSASDASDATQAATEKKESKKDEDYHRETGGEKEHRSEHDEVHEEHGRKAYEGVHKDTKTNKGHHDKEDHLDKYDDHGGIDKQHHKEDKHYGSHHHEEHGKKHAKYEESGKHSKGHSTKGSHDIHKKDEYEKKVEFFEEEGDMDDEENEGGYHADKEHSSGGHFKRANLRAAHEGHHKGEKGGFAKGGHGHFQKGHKASGGHDFHHQHGNSHHKAEGHDHGKKWVYHHGHPAKTANLVIIDRRADAYQHGPQYFG